MCFIVIEARNFGSVGQSEMRQMPPPQLNMQSVRRNVNESQRQGMGIL